MTAPRCREALKLAVQLFESTGASEHYVTRVADHFSEWLEGCPPEPELPDAGKVLRALKHIINQQEKIMTSQSDIDAATAALTAITGDVSTNVAQLQTDVTAIQAALAALPQGVDTTALDAAVAAAAGTASSLDSSVSSVTALTSPPAGG